MIFISLGKFRKKPTKESIAQSDRNWKEVERDGVKKLAIYWTLGRYDSIAIIEAPNEKAAMKALMKFSEVVATETLVALSRDEAIKLVE